ncbi:2-oxo acid dehydrogenase acyltransferase [Cooperia oncophora]
MRSKYQKEFMKKHGIKLGLMSPFVRAAAYALTENPNSSMRGLVVPVLRNVETMNYAQIEVELASLGEKARDNKLAVEDMEGGTFTISNGGVFGSVFGTPIINPPQSAILGMHGIFDRPVAINGKGEIPRTPPPVSRPPSAPISSVPVASIPVQRVTVPAGASKDMAITGAREEVGDHLFVRVKMNRMRLRIASRLKDAQNTYAMLTTFTTKYRI